MADDNKRSPWAAATVLGAAIAAGVLGWYVGSRIADERIAIMETELTAYREVEVAQLPQLSIALQQLSEDLGAQLKERKAQNALADLQKELASSQEQVASLTAELSSERGRVAALQAQLAPEQTALRVSEGTAAEVVKGQVFVGVETVGLGSACVVLGDRRKEWMSPGEQFTITVLDRTYRLVLTGIDNESEACTFAFVRVPD